MTRQRRWQLKQKEKKNCQRCGRSLEIWETFCDSCKDKAYLRRKERAYERLYE